MPLIGTAGHVDHGKSTLINALTGRDPDRWEEEKRRGLTIDLGFSWTTLPGGVEVSFVDVPGHERFLKNMLAGIEAINVALLVVAADEGWMPQSEEHLAVLDLLGVDRGVVAITKADIVDASLLELAAAEVEEQLEGTTLAGAEMVTVSALTGKGIGELADALANLAGEARASDSGRPRVWVDRSFSAKGAGTVITGSLLDGSLDTGQEVEVLPSSARARIRGIQSHEMERSSVEPGRRVALNLSGIDRDRIHRGDMVGLPSQWSLSDRMLVTIRLARYEEELKRRGAYQLHIGSAALDVRITALDGNHAVLAIDRALPAAVGDRFIIRDTGGRRVVAGGQVLDPSPGPAKRALETAASVNPTSGADSIAQALLEIRGLDSKTRIEADSGGGTPTDAITAGETVLSPTHLTQLSGKAVAVTEQEHDRHPLRPGIPYATLTERLGVAPNVTDLVIETEDRLERLGPNVRIQGFTEAVDPSAEKEWEAARTRLAAGLDVPTLTELGIDPELSHLKARQGEMVRMGNDLAYLPEQVVQITQIIRELGDRFTVAEFRDAAGLSRKYAVPILEWADSKGLTIRQGDTRRVV